LYAASIPYKIKWIGLLEGKYNDLEKMEIDRILEVENCLPIFIEDETLISNYFEFYESWLNPIFNNSSVIENPAKLETLWEAYLKVNTMFAETMKTRCQLSSKSIIFIHDNYLLMLPHFIIAFIGKRTYMSLINTQPFPSSDFFMQFPYRKELLKSMLLCSLLSFHTFQSSKHFINVVKNLMDVEFEME